MFAQVFFGAESSKACLIVAIINSFLLLQLLRGSSERNKNFNL
jgi:hypothetical protein